MQEQDQYQEQDQEEYFEEIQTMTKGAQAFQVAQKAWEQKKNASSNQYKQQTRKQTYDDRKNNNNDDDDDEFNRLCRRYDKCYYTLFGTARKLSRILETKAKNPVVPPKFLQAWEEYNYDEFHPVVLAVNKKNSWMWKKIGRISPFEAVFEKMKQQGYWLKSSLLKDKHGESYFEVSVGFYVQN
jgi:hypothetical protein